MALIRITLKIFFISPLGPAFSAKSISSTSGPRKTKNRNEQNVFQGINERFNKRERPLMRNEIILILVLPALLLPLLSLAAPGEAYGNVTHVVDGDTVYVQLQGYDNRIGNITVRLADIDCPEVKAKNGLAAKQYAFQVLNGSFVTLDLDDETGKDRFCRWVAVIFLQKQDGTLVNFNRMMVDSGYACIWDFKNNEFDPATWWNGTCPSTACKIDASGNKDSGSCSDGSLVGNAMSRKYHYSCCQWAEKIRSENKIWFSSSQDAKTQGYVPCQVCSPP
jgi:micrococcal nuclease